MKSVMDMPVDLLNSEETQMKYKLFREEGGKLIARHRFVLIAAIWRRCRVSPGERQHYRGECVNERCFFIPDAPQNLMSYTPEK